MNKLLLALWACLPVAGWAYHQGPGQDRMKLDQVDAAIARAEVELDGGNHDLALQNLEDALKDLPEDRVSDARKIRLNLNKLRLEHKQLVKAQKDLQVMVEEMSADPDADAEVLSEARRTYANAQYYITYLMRLEGYTREQWEPEIEKSRQAFRLLAEEASRSTDKTKALIAREDLESAVRLARLELSDLQGLPLPSQ